jgi:hypothetical protein
MTEERIRHSGLELEEAKTGEKFVPSSLEALVSTRIRVETSATSELGANFSPVFASSSCPAVGRPFVMSFLQSSVCVGLPPDVATELEQREECAQWIPLCVGSLI